MPSTLTGTGLVKVAAPPEQDHSMTIHRKTALACVLGGIFAAFAQGAQSHALWDPQGLIKPRSNRDDIKAGPCGVPRTNTAVTLAAGSTVNLEIERTIYHQGYFRIAFSPANDQGFDNYVLANNIAESSSQRHYSVSVTLPDMEKRWLTRKLPIMVASCGLS